MELNKIFADYKDSINFIIENNCIVLDISTIKHIRDKEYGEFHGCLKKGCYLKKLNPNSKEFISKVYRTENALQLIHSRNKSPFYSTNHSSNEDYLNYQKHSNRSENDVKKSVEKWKSTYESNKKTFIETYGLYEWNKLQKNKNIYDVDKFGQEVVCKNKSKTAPKNKFIKGKINEMWIKSNYSKFINDEQLFKNHCLAIMGKNCSIIGFCMLLEKAENIYKNSSNVNDGYRLNKRISKLIAFKHTFCIPDLFDYFSINKFIKKEYKNYLTKKSYSYSCTIDEHFFRSALEMNFYLSIKDIDNVEIIDTNKKYPDVFKFYDIKIKYKNEEYIIELCSFNSKKDNFDYCENVESKASKFGSILVYNTHKFIDDLQNGRGLTHGYY